jgi:hypothetical protein
MDYRRDVHYDESCSVAVQNGIIVNTIQCGNYYATERVWREIAELGRGDYVALAQSGNVTIITTPYDEEILGLSAELNETVVMYGPPELQELTRSKLSAAEAASADVAADRAAFNLSTGGKVVQGRGDLVADWRSGLVELSQLDPDTLPRGMRSMDALEIQHYLERMQAERDRLNFRLADLNGDRAAYLHREQARLAAEGGGDAFDTQVTRMLEEQASRIR